MKKVIPRLGVLLAIIALAISAILPLNRAYAWTSQPTPTCAKEQDGKDFFEEFDWPAKIKAIDANFKTNPTTQSIIAYCSSGQHYIVYLNPDGSDYDTRLRLNMHITDNPVSYSIDWTTTTSIQKYNCYYGYNYTCGSSTAPSGGQITAVDGFHFVKNISYINWGDNPKLDDGQKYLEQIDSCSGLDIECYLSSAWSTATKELGHLITVLFVPDKSITEDLMQKLQNGFSEKLGFLNYPVVFMSSLYTAFQGVNNDCATSVCELSFGNIFGHEFKFKPMLFEQVNHTAMNFFLLTIRGITVIVLLLGLMYKVRYVMRSV